MLPTVRAQIRKFSVSKELIQHRWMARTFDSSQRDALRTTAIRVRMKPSVKAMAEQLAQREGRSLSDWLERLIAAEKARRDGKK